jgi:hypothetical protein
MWMGLGISCKTVYAQVGHVIFGLEKLLHSQGKVNKQKKKKKQYAHLAMSFLACKECC